MQKLTGIAASPGLGIGPIVLVEVQAVVVPEFEKPMTALADAMAAVSNQMSEASKKATEAGRTEAGEVLSAQALMAEDPMWEDAIEYKVGDGMSLGDALNEAAEGIEQMMASLPDPYLASRASDVGEVAQALRRNLAGLGASAADVSVPSVLVASALTAAETADLDPKMVLGFATEEGGPTGHVAIIARSLGVPAVVGTSGLLAAAKAGESVAIDGGTGEIAIDPDEATLADMQARGERAKVLAEEALAAQGTIAEFNGKPIHVGANVGRSADIDEAVKVAANGVGLFRTEFLFLDRPTPPTEEEQYELYAKAASECDGQVIIRTFDIGGDKPAEFLDMEADENPFLGMRGVRIYEDHADLFDAQVRAAVRASAHGDLALMIPMVATVEEFRKVRSRIAEIGDIKVGVMVEVPSIALTAHAIANEADFFSIGTNDLTQYTLAADRTHGSLGTYQDPLHPAVLRLCAETVKGADTGDKPVSVCGVAAADPLAACVFVALGVRKLSVTPASVNVIKSVVSKQSPELVGVVNEALATCGSAQEFKEAVAPHVVGL